MQKKIIALAVAGLASTAAFAQTNVTIYGLLDASAYVTDGNGTKAANYGFLSNALTTSRLGFKGTEDLGNGLKAVFALEQEISLATGGEGSGNTGFGNGTFNRAANVGLSSNKLGTITLGRQAAPLYAAVAASDVLGANSGGLTNAWVYTNVQTGSRVLGAATGLSNASFATNTQNAFVAGVGYASPVIAGLQVKAFTNMGNNTADAQFANGGLRDIAVSYAGFGANVRAAYQEQMGAAASTDRVEKKNTLLAGDYTIGGLKLAAAWARTSFDNPLAVSDVTTATAGATYQMGKANVGFSYTDSRATSEGTGQHNAAKQYAVLAKYSLSKRTDVYALGTHVVNEGTANMQGIYTANTLSATGVNPSSLALGVRHAF